jgi:NADH-quinone oxidoreductase subunit I
VKLIKYQALGEVALVDVRGIAKAFFSGVRHLFVKRSTRRYPEAGTGLPESYYSYDTKKGVGIAGWRGRHYLEMDKCTGCQQCAIMCDGISTALLMIEMPDVKYSQNKKSVFPGVDYGRCVFCGLCVDACPFECLHMTPDIELADYDRNALWYSPKELATKPRAGVPTYLVGKRDEKKTEGTP